MEPVLLELWRGNMNGKICTICHIFKLYSNFYSKKGSLDKYISRCKECRSKYNKLHNQKIQNNPSLLKKKHLKEKRYYQKLKDRAFDVYGGYICACCGETEKLFLTIDHVNGGGTEHSKTIGRGKLYFWLRQNNYPTGFQILCMNCQFGKYIDGLCPHKRV